MHGAGRPARSLRSPRPQADLKAAAMGALLLAREWLGLRRRAVRPSIDREPPRRLLGLLERLPNRTGIAATVLLLLGSAGLGVIADDGAVLEPYLSRRFISLPLVVGKGAESHARDFLALLAQYPLVRATTKAAIFVGERRWNLRLNDGLDIRLPEHDVGNALAALTKFDKEDRLFSRDIVAVDMRLPDRLTVQLSEDAAKNREELFKKQSKKKAGDA